MTNTTWLRTQPCAIHLVEECRVTTPIRQSLLIMVEQNDNSLDIVLTFWANFLDTHLKLLDISTSKRVLR